MIRMTRLEYLEKYHELSGTLIGIISLCDTLEDVKRYNAIYRLKLDEIYIQRIHSLGKESGWTEEQLARVLEIVR